MKHLDDGDKLVIIVHEQVVEGKIFASSYQADLVLMNGSQGVLVLLGVKGKAVMMFVQVNHFKEREETEPVTSPWEMGLYNNHV